MNIFYVHKDPVVAAKMLIDKHVVKMIIESAQMLSTAHRLIDGEQYEDRTKSNRRIKRWRLKDKAHEDIIYKASHVKHPSTIWVMASAYNYYWLYNHMVALNDEFKLRYNHTVDHMTIRKLGIILRNPPKGISLSTIRTDPTPAMPDECKIPGDVVGSYRKYYVMKKKEMASWKAPSQPPQWYTEGVENGL